MPEENVLGTAVPSNVVVAKFTTTDHSLLQDLERFWFDQSPRHRELLEQQTLYIPRRADNVRATLSTVFGEMTTGMRVVLHIVCTNVVLTYRCTYLRAFADANKESARGFNTFASSSLTMPNRTFFVLLSHLWESL